MTLQSAVPSIDTTALPDAPAMLAHYQLRGRLGEGGFGQVFEAWDTQLHRSVAIKRLKNVSSVNPENLIREARMAASLRHAAFVKIHAIEADHDSQSIVMELVPGQTLKALLQSEAPDEKRALEIAHQIAEAMQEAHATRLIHGDLKPANLIIEPSGKVRILDFGLASHVDAQETGSLSELDPQGTIAYMAPERLLGTPPNAQGDIYALGVMLYEMVSGTRPFATLSGLALAAAHVQSSSDLWVFPPQVPAGVARLVRAMTAKKPEQRMKSMADVTDAIATLQRTQVLPELTGASWSLPVRRLARKRPWTIVAVLSVLMLGFAGWQAVPYYGAIRQAMTPYSESLEMKNGLEALRLFDRRGSLDIAMKSFNTILEHDSENAAAVAGLSIAYSFKYVYDGQDDIWLQKCDASAQQALKLNDQLALSYVAKARALDIQWKNDQSLTAVDRALSLDPNNLFAWLGKVDELTKLRRYDDAKNLALTGLQRFPGEHGFANGLGFVHYEQGDNAAAEKAFRLSIKIQPDAVVSYANLDAVLLKLNRSDEALQVLQQGLQIRPSGWLYSNLGTDLFFRGDYLGAVAAFEHAVSPDKGNPNRYLAWANLADTLLWVPGRKEEARKAYEKARQLLEPLIVRAPNNIIMVSRMALYSARVGDKDNAEKLIQQSIALSPKNPGVYFRAGLAHELLGNRNAALNELAKAKEFGYSVKSIESEPDLVELRRDARYLQH